MYKRQVLIKPLAESFNLVPLNTIQWLYTIGISLLPIIIMEIQKKVNQAKWGEKVYVNKNKFTNVNS